MSEHKVDSYDVVVARERYQDLIHTFLIERGWTINDHREYAKGKICLLTDEEAFHYEFTGQANE